MATRPKRVAGTEIVLESNGGAITDGAAPTEMIDDDLQALDIGGLFTATLEIDVAAFTVAPTAGNELTVIQQAINSDGNDAPDIDADYQEKHFWTFELDANTSAQYMRKEGLPVNLTGAKFWIYWADGGSGTQNLPSGWAARIIMEDVQSEDVV